MHVPGDLIAGEKIILRGDDIGLPEQTYSALDDVGPVPVVDTGFNEPDGHPPLLVVKLGDEGLSGFGAAHCAVFEVKLCHSDLSCLVDGCSTKSVHILAYDSTFGRGLQFSLLGVSKGFSRHFAQKQKEMEKSS